MKIKSTFYSAFLFLFCFFATGSLNAQMVGPDCYIKATSVEIGLDGDGGFEGANTTVSPYFPGMHYRSGTQYFGFVANPQVNAWATFDGDFFTPGTPENGWGVEVGSATGLIAGNNCNSLNQIPGAINDYTHFFDCYSATWEGDQTSGTDIHWVVNYLAQENDLYYTTTVSITNNTATAIPELYYYRNLDPDNNQPISLDFSTTNTIVSQPGSGCNLAHVKATSLLPASQPQSYLGLAGIGSNFRVCYGGFSNRDGSDLWNGGVTGTGTFTQTIGATNSADEGISLSYKVINLAPGATEVFKFVVILDDAAATNAINNLLFFSYPGSALAPPPACTPYVDTVNTCGSPVPISVTGSVISDFNWVWTPAGGLSSTSGATVIANPGVTTTYTVTGTPINPCYQPVTMAVVVQVTPAGGANPVITPVPIQCVSSLPFALSVDSTGGVWSGTGITDDSLGIFDPGTAGPGTYTILYTTAEECNNSDTVVIIVNAADATITQPPVVCANDPAFNLSAVSSGGTWTGTGITSGSAGTFDPVVAGAGAFTISYTLTGVCASVDTVIITVGAVITPVTGFTYPTPVCASGANPSPTTMAGFTSGGIYSSTAGLSINNATGLINLTATTPGTYTVTYTVAATICGPAGTTSFVITIDPIIIPVLTFSYNSVCISDTNQYPITGLTFTPGGTYTSTPGLVINATTGVVDVAGSTPGSYTVSYSVIGDTAVGICTASGTSTANITINPLPFITISQDITMWIGSTAQLFATGGTNYSWDNPTSLGCSTCDSTAATPMETTTYCVIVTDGNGCVDSTCMKVTVEIPCPGNRDLVAPNAFTPNGDGNNDLLCLDGWDDCVTEFKIYIYDRWGEKVFESSNSSFCWDGYYKGKLLDPAVFVYFIKATYLTAGQTINDPEGALEITKKGNISLVR